MSEPVNHQESERPGEPSYGPVVTKGAPWTAVGLLVVLNVALLVALIAVWVYASHDETSDRSVELPEEASGFTLTDAEELGYDQDASDEAMAEANDAGAAVGWYRSDEKETDVAFVSVVRRELPDQVFPVRTDPESEEAEGEPATIEVDGVTCVSVYGADAEDGPISNCARTGSGVSVRVTSGVFESAEDFAAFVNAVYDDVT